VGPSLTGTLGRVRLRPLAAEDADAVVRWRNEPSVAQQMFSPPPVSREAHLRWFERARVGGDREEFIILWRASGAEAAVGTIGLSHIEPQHGRAEYGILIGDPSARGQGVARAASELLLDYAFGPRGLERVYLQAFADNAAALQLYVRLGFVREGVLRRHARRDGEPRDVVVMGILKDEWLGRARERTDDEA